MWSTLRSIVVVIGLVFIVTGPAIAASPPPQLVISQFKLTTKDGQYFMLYNAGSEPVDMGSAQLTYYNHYELAKATSSKIIPLQGLLQPGEYYLVNDGPYTLCYRMIVNSLSLGLSTTAGTLQLQTLGQTATGGAITTTQHDYVSWSKTRVTGVQQLPESNALLLRQPLDAENNPSVTAPGSGNWTVATSSSTDPCSLTRTEVTGTRSVISTSLLLLASTPPPVTILSRLQEPTGPYLPPSDVGLIAPVVNELLANPGNPLTDANDEFIEIYNPNDKQFDLTGFSVKVGLDSTKSYKFPAGTLLEPHSFTAFYSDATNLALSNSGSRAALVDPFGNSISVSHDYASAKDNQSWALANNEWVTTTTPTPGEENIITGAESATSGSGGSAPGGSSEPRNYGRGTPSAPGSVLGNSSSSEPAKVADLHPTTLAGVAALAVGYGAYEYRSDMANRLRQLRANRAARLKNR